MNAERTYKIGEAARLLKLEPSVLRYWESEFPQITPTRSDKGTRLYTGEDIALLRRIQHLLHEQGLTIAGARRILFGNGENEADGGILATVKSELVQIREILTAGNREGL